VNAAAGAAPPHVVVLGAGFGGLTAVRRLAPSGVRITLVDRTNHHLFQPLLYQVAMAGLSAPDIAAPIRHLVRRHRNVTVLLATAESIDVGARRVRLQDEDVPYDALVLATGATHSYFGHNDWAAHAPGLKTLDDALQIRRRVLVAFEEAERAGDDAERAAWMTFAIVGAGPTGVELAGSIAEMARHTLASDFRRIDPRRTTVLLLEGTDRVLPPYHPRLSESARRQLEALGVQVRTGARVTKIEERAVWLGEERIATRTVLWAAGVAASPLGRSLGAPLDRAGRVVVQPDLSIPGHPEVFVVGDLAAFEQDGKPVPGVAPAANQMGRLAADNVQRVLRGEPTRPFRYLDKGSLSTIGRSAAVAEVGPLKMSGLLAWLAWLGIHILFLINFRSRVVVMLEWAIAYFTWGRSARLIVGPLPRRE
jgi:NADH dehydrogenase